MGPTSASFYYYGTEHDSRGVAKRVSYCLGSWPETSLDKAAEAMRKLRDAGPTGRIAERWTVRAVLADLEKERLARQKKGHEVAAVLRLHAMEARPEKRSPPFGEWRAAPG